jgi:hypothetical protein
MFRIFRKIGFLAALAIGSPAAFGFSLFGPPPGQTAGADQWQVSTIGFMVPLYNDIGTPKNLGEEYRRNTPVMYYACDANFLDYFGSNGVTAIDQGFAAYNFLTNVSLYSGDLGEFPFSSLRRNFEAGSLRILDVKSYLMTMLAENVGLASADRYVWVLHDRFHINGAPPCPAGMFYLVTMRNFDPGIATAFSTIKYTPYVNGTLYSYVIQEFCTGPDPLADAVEFTVDPTADAFQAVSSAFFPLSTTSPYGAFFTGLTRDDVGGLRYMLSKNNMNVENAGPGTTVFLTNTQPVTLFTSNLTLFAAQALTNPPAALQALYPNLIITSTSNYFTLVTNITTTAFFTNSPYAPVGTPPQIGFFSTTNVTIGSNFVYSFGNVFTVSNSSHGLTAVPLLTIPPPNGTLVAFSQTIAITNAGGSPYAPFGTAVPVLKISSPRVFATNAVVGDFFILPPTDCGEAILSQFAEQLAFSTNVVFSATNFTGTNSVTTTNVPESVTQTIVTVTTNRVFLALPITCPPDVPTLREGIEKMSFVRRDFDSLLGRIYNPITNEYYLNAITNNTVLGQRVQRVVTQPDFLITAQDLAEGPNGPNGTDFIFARNVNFDTTARNAGLAGPGTITTPTTFIFNKVGPVFQNEALVDTNAFLTEILQSAAFTWGSFDGTTNQLVLYPNDVSIDNLANEVLVHISPTYLPSGIVGSGYSAELQSTPTDTWVAPFTWALAPNSPGLPPGLSFSTDPTQPGLITGTPTEAGAFDFVIRVTDSQGRTIDRSFSITITL